MKTFCVLILGQAFSISNDKGNIWQTGGWKVSTSEEEQPPTASPWKNNGPSKSSNLVSITWKSGEDKPLDSTAVNWDQGQWPGANIEPTWLFQGCKMTLKCGLTGETHSDNNEKTNPPDTSDDGSIATTTIPSTNIGKGWPPKQNGGKSWKPPLKSWKPPKWKQPTSPPTSPETMNPTMMWKSPPTPKINWKKPTAPPVMWKQPPSTMMWTETTPTLPEMTWKPPPSPVKWKKGPKPSKSWKPPPTKSWKPPPTKSWKPPPMKNWKPHPTKSWKPPKLPTKTWQPSIATPQPDMWPTTKPDCKDTTVTMQPPPKPTEDDLMEPPQIIIITKLPKGSAPGPSDKKDKGNMKPPFGPWIFPSRKYNPKTSKNRKDKNIPISSKRRPNRPSRNNSNLPNMMKGWPKGMPPPKFAWPNDAMRRWTTKNPSTLSPWKSKYSKSRTWREMLKKWMSNL